MTYTNQEKAAIVAQYRQGIPIHVLCRDYGVCERTIYRWVQTYCDVIPDERHTVTAKEYDMLLCRVTKLEDIVEILKTVNCTAKAPLKERLCELELLYGQYDVHTLCDALDVSRGTFYNHICRNKRGNAWFEKRREEYRVLIREVFDEYRQVLGPGKICTILAQRGYQTSTRFVTELMREMGLFSVRATAKQDYLKLREPEKKQNILKRQFHADGPNEVCFEEADAMSDGREIQE